jgi:hypothetical protein
MANISLANGASGAAIVAGAGSNLGVSEDMIDTLRKGWSSHGKGEKYLAAFFDLADAQGWADTHFIAVGKDGSTATEASWERCKLMVTSAMPKGVQTLLAMPAEAARGQVAADWDGNDYTKSGQPKDKRYWQQQVGARIAKLGDQWRELVRARAAKENFLRLKDMIAAGDTDGALALKGEMERAQPRKNLQPSEFLDQAFTDTLKRIERAKSDAIDLPMLREAVLRFRAEVRKLAKGQAAE